MQTTSGLLAYLEQRFGLRATLWLSLLLVLLAVTAVLVAVAVGESLAATSDPSQVAPVRWIRRA